MCKTGDALIEGEDLSWLDDQSASESEVRTCLPPLRGVAIQIVIKEIEHMAKFLTRSKIFFLARLETTSDVVLN